ncbi:unnamed protein product [Parajaminaea phylloscopi]
MSEKTAVKVVFGTMTFGREGAEQARVFKPDDCQKILDVVKAHGHDELDTARMYGAGTSEEMLKQLGAEKQGFKIATKVFPSARMPGLKSPTLYDHTRDGVKKALQDSLTALGTGKVDLYYLHAPDREVSLEETLAAVNEEYELGKFQRFGISNYRADEIKEILAIIEKKQYKFRVDVYQGLYNSITRSAESELIPLLKEHKISYYCYNPLGGGFFTGRIKSPEDAVEEGSRFDEKRWQGQMYRKRYYREEYWKAIKVVSDAAEQSGLTMAEVALRWMQHHSALDRSRGDAIIVGASSTKHIEQNLADFEKGPLPEAVVKAVDEAWSIVQPNSPPYHF